jgi:hypothetical protein
MGRKRKELLSSAPWRTGEAAEDEDAARMSREGKVSVTSNPGETPTMSVPRSRRPDLDLTVDDFEEDEIDPELRYSFQRNSRVPYTPTRPSFFFGFSMISPAPARCFAHAHARRWCSTDCLASLLGPSPLLGDTVTLSLEQLPSSECPGVGNAPVFCVFLDIGLHWLKKRIKKWTGSPRTALAVCKLQLLKDRIMLILPPWCQP